jgi:MYXO-CTERM domain-containing protein
MGAFQFIRPVAALVVLVLSSSPYAWATTSNWDGSTGGWFNLHNISHGCMHWSTCKPDGTGTPGEGGDTFNVDIGSGAVTLNSGAIILNVMIGSGATLTGVTTSYLQFDTPCGACALVNNGRVTFNGNSYIDINTSSLTISGTGTVTMGGPHSTIASSPGIGATLINQESIQGRGQIGKGETAILNQGTINANVSGGTLFVQSDASGITNPGLLEASNGGTLNIIQSATVPLNNAGGKIEALNGSTVMNAAGVITGGILTTSGTGVIESSGGNPILHNLTNAGAYVIPLNNLATLEGTINNTGTIAVGSSAGNGILYIDGKVTLSGSGIVTLVDAGIAQSGIHSLSAGAQLTNRTTIQGAGVIGDAGLKVVNEGAIIANAHDPLSFTDAGFTNSNTGLVQATHGATLNIFSRAFNNQGTLRVDSGSTLNFNGSVYTQSGASSVTNILHGGVLKAGTVNWNGGAMNVSGTLDPLSLKVCASCTLTGTGSVVANVNSVGVVAAGTATGPGTLSINGPYAQGTAGELVINLAGATAGHYSVLDVSGNAALGGAVDFVATGGFHPSSGEDFTFLLFGSESGSFNNVEFTNWSCPRGDTCKEVRGSHSLSLDISGGHSVGSAGTGVPEPPTWLLGLTGLIWLIVWRRRAPVH